MKHLLILLALLCFSSTIYSQSYFPTADQNPLWTFSISWPGFTGKDSIELLPEVQICDELWNPVRRFGDEGIVTMGYIRQVNKKVLFRRYSACQEKVYIMYDFSLETGDSLYVGTPGTEILGNPELDTSLVWVIETDSMFFGNVKRKVFHLGYVQNQFPTRIWVEGIGDLHHPFYSGTCLYPSSFCEGFDVFLCAQTDQGVLYSNGQEESCQYFPNRWHVNTNLIGGANDGSSWPNAFYDLQDAIATADYGDTIWVAQGTYYPTSDNDREKYFELKNGVAIYGGFSGTETHLNQRNYQAYKTILSGDIGIQGESTDNSYHLLYSVDSDSTTSIDGFTITKGYAVHENTSYFGHLTWGGGFYIGIEDSSLVTPLIRNCMFEKNIAKHGGGLYCDGATNKSVIPSLVNCVFKNNHSFGTGGAIFHKNGTQDNINFVITDCIFEENSSSQEGGAIQFTQVRHSTILKGCQFLKNHAISDGGAVFFEGSPGDAQLDMVDCDFFENIGASGGGFSFLYTGFSVNDSVRFEFSISNSTFYKNQTMNSAGGAIAFQNNGNICEAYINNSNFIQNQSVNGGGAVYAISDPKMVLFVSHCAFIENQTNIGASGAIFSKTYFDPIVNNLTINNSLFANNAGAIAHLGSNGKADGLIQNCTFLNNGGYPILKNWSPDFDYVSFYNQMKIRNSIIWEPSLPLGRILYNNNPDTSTIHDFLISNTLISTDSCNLPGGDLACGEGILFNQNPLFLDSDALDLRLAACSPAINMGTNPDSLVNSLDLAGQPRILDDVIDMGAYERNAFKVQLEGVSTPSCYGSQDGVVAFNVEGDTPFVYHWSNDSLSGDGLSQLAAGNYLFSISDANNCMDTFSLSLTAPMPLSIQYSITPASNPNSTDGSIVINELLGGTPPYQLLWNNGDTTTTLLGVPPGQYLLTITDSNNCTRTDTFELTFITSTDHPIVNQTIRLFPNPAVEYSNIFFAPTLTTTSLFTIRNSLGKVLFSQAIPAFTKNQRINIQHLPPGLYFYSIHAKEHTLKAGKVVIVRR
jgi:hypothetical protein